MRTKAITILFVPLLAMLAAALPAAAQQADSAAVYRFELLYRGRYQLERSSVAFPYNDPEIQSHLSDRLAALLVVDPLERLSLFAKGATGERADGRPGYRERFYLDQAHIHYADSSLGLGGRLFIRERVYRSTFRLMPLITNESSFTGARGEGARLDYANRDAVRLRYIGAMLREGPGVEESGGFPRFHGGGDVLHSLEADIRPLGPVRLGAAAQQVRSTRAGDSGLLALGAGIDLFGLDLNAELAQSIDGVWGESDTPLFDFDFGGLSDGGFSSIFPLTAAFEAELDGLSIEREGLGTLRVVPGYRYSGTGFRNPAGEISPGLVESSISLWWRHPSLDMQAAVEARDSYLSSVSEERTSILLSSRARLRGGFDARASMIHIVDEKPVLVLTLLDENARYRVSASARADSVGAGDRFSFLSSGSFNLTGSVALRSDIYLYRSTESLYSVQLEFRPRNAFLFVAGFGSFLPCAEEIAFHRESVLPAPCGERMIVISGRIWFGRL